MFICSIVQTKCVMNCKELLQQYQDAISDEIFYRKDIANKNYELIQEHATVTDEILEKNNCLAKKKTQLDESLKQFTCITYEELKETISAEIVHLEEEVEILKGEIISLISHKKQIESNQKNIKDNIEKLCNYTHKTESVLRNASMELLKTLKITGLGRFLITTNFCDMIAECKIRAVDLKLFRLPEFFEETERKLFQNISDELNLSFYVIQFLSDNSACSCISQKNMSICLPKICSIIDPVKKISKAQHERAYIFIDSIGNFIKFVNF